VPPNWAFQVCGAMFLKMLEGYPDAARRLREIILSRNDQWTREVETCATRSRGTKPAGLDIELPMLLPGIKVSTAPKQFFPVR
jgi:hypothetical protein